LGGPEGNWPKVLAIKQTGNSQVAIAGSAAAQVHIYTVGAHSYSISWRHGASAAISNLLAASGKIDNSAVLQRSV